MKKTIPALLAGFLITAIIGAGMLVIGWDAFSTSSASAAPLVNKNEATQFTQLLVNYQIREIQYQQQIQSANNEIKVANQVIEQANRQLKHDISLLAELQNRGMITISQDTIVTIH